MVELASLIMVEEDEETTIGWLPPSITLFFFRSFISLLHGAITCYRFSLPDVRGCLKLYRENKQFLRLCKAVPEY